MQYSQFANPLAVASMCVLLLLNAPLASAGSQQLIPHSEFGTLWAHENLHAWCAVPFDAKQRGPEERAQMLERLGIRTLAYDWRMENVPHFDEELETLKKHNIRLLAWWFPFDADYPEAKDTLELFKRHGVHPQLWVMQHYPNQNLVEWGMLPKERAMEGNGNGVGCGRNDSPKSPQEQAERVRCEADRIQAIVALAAPYGSKVAVYSHNGWFGVMDNEVAIIEALKRRGVRDVGIVYNFSHMRDQDHDDTQNFSRIWSTIKPYVVAVNITGTSAEEKGRIYPSQGDRELEMMRIIQQSGWRGPVGIIAENGGDAEVTLRNYLIGLDWLAAELTHPGSGGLRPFGLAH